MHIEKVFKRLGKTISGFDKYGNLLITEKAFIQPLRYKNKMYLEGIPTEIGLNESGYYLFLGPASFDVESLLDGGYMSSGNMKYHIDRFEKIYFGENVRSVWAILRQSFPDTNPVYNHFA